MKINFFYSFLLSLLFIISCRNADDDLGNLEGTVKSNLASKDYSLKNWMSQIPNHIYLGQLSIPGTHDSGAMYEWRKIIEISGSAKAQSLTIHQQLNSGVRFLDMRANHEMNIYHGAVDQHLKLDQVLAVLETFLRENPSETVIMSLKRENTNQNTKFDENFTKLYNKYSSIFVKSNMLPAKLGSVRGKVILMTRFGSQLGLPATNWKDNTTFSISTSFYESPYTGQLNIQDFYNPNSSRPGPATEEKKNKVNDLIFSSMNDASVNKIYINYLSVAMTGTGIIPFAGARDIINTKNIMNPWMVQKIKPVGRIKLGIVVFDYITATESRAIINTN